MSDMMSGIFSITNRTEILAKTKNIHNFKEDRVLFDPTTVLKCLVSLCTLTNTIPKMQIIGAMVHAILCHLYLK